MGKQMISSQKNLIASLFLLALAYFLASPFLDYFKNVFLQYDVSGSINHANYAWDGLINQFRYGNQYLINLWVSLKITLIGSVLSCLFSACVAYALVVYQFRFKSFFLLLLIVLLLVPEFVKTIPFFIMVDRFNLLNTHVPLIIPFLVPSLGVFIIKYYFESIYNPEVIEAARLEGANEWQIFIHIILQQLKPAIAICLVIQFTFFWNSAELSTFIIGEETLKPIAHVARRFIPYDFISALIIIVPVMVLLLAGKYISEFLHLQHD